MGAIDFCNKTDIRILIKKLKDTPRDIDIIPLYTYLCPVIIFICFFSITFNAILITISRQSQLVNKSPILLLSLNLAVTDLIASLLNGLSILVNSYLYEVHGIHLGQCSMLMFEVIRCAALVASALHLLALAFVHYRGIVNPLHYRTINIISIACWIIPLTIMIALFSSTPCQGFTFRYVVLTLFALPLLLMSAIYLRIFIIISKHQKGRRLNHERSTLSRVAMSASGPIGASMNLPELISKKCSIEGTAKENIATTAESSTAEEELGDPTTTPTQILKVACDHCLSRATNKVDPIDSPRRTRAPKRGEKVPGIISSGSGPEATIENCFDGPDRPLMSECVAQVDSEIHCDNKITPSKEFELIQKQITKDYSIPTRLPHSGQLFDKPIPSKQISDSEAKASPTSGSVKCKCGSSSSQLNATVKQVKMVEAKADSETGAQTSLGKSDSGIGENTKSSLTRTSTHSSQGNKGQFIGNMMTVSLANQRSSISSAVAHSSLRSHFRRSPTSNSGSQITDFRSNQTFNITSSCHDNNNNNNNNNNSSTYEPQRRHIHASATPQTNTKALVTTLLILGTYFISYIPAIVMQVLTCVDYCPYPLYDVSFSKRILFGSITLFLLIGKSIIDPFIYSYRMSEIQVAVNRYISQRRSKNASSMHLSTNQRLNNASIQNTTHQFNNETSYATSSFRILNQNQTNKQNSSNSPIRHLSTSAISRHHINSSLAKANNSTMTTTTSIKFKKSVQRQPEVEKPLLYRANTDKELLVEFHCDTIRSNSNGQEEEEEEEEEEDDDDLVSKLQDTKEGEIKSKGSGSIINFDGLHEVSSDVLDKAVFGKQHECGNRQTSNECEDELEDERTALMVEPNSEQHQREDKHSDTKLEEQVLIYSIEEAAAAAGPTNGSPSKSFEASNQQHNNLEASALASDYDNRHHNNNKHNRHKHKHHHHHHHYHNQENKSKS